MKNRVESVVIATNEYGSVASIRFNDSKDDRDISSPNKQVLYGLIEKHIKQAQK